MAKDNGQQWFFLCSNPAWPSEHSNSTSPLTNCLKAPAASPASGLHMHVQCWMLSVLAFYTWTSSTSLLTFFCNLITDVHFFSRSPAYFLSNSSFWEAFKERERKATQKNKYQRHRSITKCCAALFSITKLQSHATIILNEMQITQTLENSHAMAYSMEDKSSEDWLPWSETDVNLLL